MRNYNYLASRMLGTPLLIERGKLDAILTALSPRLGIEMPEPAAATVMEDSRQRKPYTVTTDGVAIISVIGPLVKRQSGMFLSGGPTTYSQIESEFLDAVSDPEIKGILLEVDSPGGEAGGAFELADTIYENRGVKPIGCAVDGDAFSAAFAIASAADWVCLTKTGGVGSVGVWMLHVDRSAQNGLEGLKPTYIFAGARKLDGNPDSPLSAEARAVFQALVDRIYGIFVDCVARNRGMDAAAVTATDAGLFFGDSAVAAGFADQTGTFAGAMNRLCTEIQRPAMPTMAAGATSSVASATGNKKENKRMADIKAPAEAQAPTAAEIEAQVTQARESGAAETLAIVELCAIAGKSGLAAGFLASKSTRAQVTAELLKQRVADSGPETASHILPEAGTSTEVKPSQSAVVKACEALAATAKGGK